MFVAATQDKRYAGMRQVSRAWNVPAPTGGLNARDAFTDMKPDDAVGLTNVFPEANYVALRKGYASSTTGLGAAVRTLLTWQGLTGADKLFGGAGSKIWDCTTGTASAAVNGLTNVDFQWINLQNAGGMYLLYVNGADAYGAYDGTTWTTPAVTGVTSSTFIQITQFKQRVWFAVKNSLDLWYLPVQAIAGAASVFPLGAVFRKGGYVCGLGSFSNDAGEGPDDYFCIITSNGEVAVYQGTNPDSATTWALVGVFNLGKPIGRRSMVHINGDLSIVTQDGVISMQAALQYGRESIQKAAITGKIQTLFSQYSTAYFTNFGWQPFVYPKARYLIVNVPAITNSSQTQLVMNTVTGSWCLFQGMNAGSWGAANDLLYFGGNDGTVYQAYNGNMDAGSAINFDLQTAWQLPGGDANKYFTMVQPIMLNGGGISHALTVDVDFQTTIPTGSIPAIPSGGMTWTWTWPGTWGGTTILDSEWHSVGAIGTWASVHMNGQSTGPSASVNAFSVVAMTGGIL